jgi:hypothetical protein
MAYSGTFIFRYALETVFSGGPWEDFDATRKNLTVDPPFSGILTGDANYTVSGNGQIELSDGPLGPGNYHMGDLPVGFRFLTIDRMNSGGVGDDLPAGFGGNGLSQNLTTDWAITEFGWSPGDSTVDSLVQQMIWTAVNFTVSLSYDAAGGLQNVQAYPKNNDSEQFTTFTGTWDDSGNTANTPETPDVVAGPGDDEITVTPGNDTTLIIVDDEVIAVTPGVPVIVTIVGPVVEVTPVNTEPSLKLGPPVEIGVPFSYETVLILDVAIAPTILALTNPSGIYTLVPGKTDDTLYDRVAGTTVAISVDVAIPDPFGITAYIPGND